MESVHFNTRGFVVIIKLIINTRIRITLTKYVVHMIANKFSSECAKITFQADDWSTSVVKWTDIINLSGTAYFPTIFQNIFEGTVF